MKYKHILITGGAGFIGSNLSLKLVEKGYNVTVLDNLSPQIHGKNGEYSELYQNIKDVVRFIKGSVLSYDDWKQALDGVDVVVHLAAETGTGQSMYEIEKYTDVNIKGTSIFLDILANEKHSIKKIVVASSRAVYGEGKYRCPNDGIVYPTERKDVDMAKGDFDVKCPICGEKVEPMATDENSKIHPSSIYGITKQVQEQMCMVMGKSLRIPTVAFRYQNVYGPGQSLSNPYTGILSIFSTRIKNGSDVIIFEDGKESRDFVYIDDVVNATILGIEKDEANYEVFNVGFGQKVDVLTVAKALVKEYKSSSKIIISGNYRLGDIRNNYADLTKIREILGFEPKVSFEEGIRKFTEWVNTQEVKQDSYEKSIKEMRERGLYK
ncbi:NAD-dependent epimerase/dehydratase family protein [Geobacillus stearothermophilus]|uniref:NAD-dependent epimerase/dehydratase family protein n=1 Tax=Geobacillus stearothermophilus TaxID=1422 RepID=UPI002E204C21|nr:NAD-dependent epimerase/dehydratase family protein [Geobacillus stearothermophilus]MED3778590.1 NAD-dependent epimerase/dehydratase family protein [Geobacillus stearothermophilus]MED4830811.1 NAD-dependent epimerase/dehydratase family protein [Geobacillus stearothermophilus]MED4959979.1 NAD-dependent epimerase/dehydratase family protein [Geobacillus stearothermophilus]